MCSSTYTAEVVFVRAALSGLSQGVIGSRSRKTEAGTEGHKSKDKTGRLHGGSVNR
jgi:hypothetical protein